MAELDTDKLELFGQSIRQRAAAEQSEILRATEERKREELGQEEDRLLEESYRKLQACVGEIKTATVREISSETLELKKQLYRQREQYLTELLAMARVELSEFVKGADYESYLLGKVETLAREHRYDGSVLRLRTDDLGYEARVKALYGSCTVLADDVNISIGGVILENASHGVEFDCSLDAALAEQRDWFYKSSNFNFGGEVETA